MLCDIADVLNKGPRAIQKEIKKTKNLFILKKHMNFISKKVNNYPRKKFGYQSSIEVFIGMGLNKKTLELNRLAIVPQTKSFSSVCSLSKRNNEIQQVLNYIKRNFQFDLSKIFNIC